MSDAVEQHSDSSEEEQEKVSPSSEKLTGRCFSCKKTTEFADPVEYSLSKNNRNRASGKCSTCGSKMSKFTKGKGEKKEGL